jgi:hypothetical protein
MQVKAAIRETQSFAVLKFLSCLEKLVLEWGELVYGDLTRPETIV